MKYIACCSGGKDSVATVILAHENGEPLDEVVFSEVMFSQNISGELPEHIDFIKNVLFPKFNEWGYSTKILHSGETMIEWFFHIVKHSNFPERNGKLMGFPCQKGCIMNSRGKVNAIDRYISTLSEEVKRYVGIAIDEPERLERANSKKQISLLEKYGYTEQMSYDKCKEYGLLSPIYTFAKRGGCWFCPNASRQELYHLRQYHPELWQMLLYLEKCPHQVNPVFSSMSKLSVNTLEQEFQFEDAQIKFEI